MPVRDVTKCTEAPRRLPNCVAIAETSHSSWRCTLHGILPAPFFPGEGQRGYCVSSSRSRGFESLADISDGVQSLPAAFAVEAWIIKKGEEGRRRREQGIEGIFWKGILNFKDWKGSVFQCCFRRLDRAVKGREKLEEFFWGGKLVLNFKIENFIASIE